jgi:lysophospholipase L1-like esterase
MMGKIRSRMGVWVIVCLMSFTMAPQRITTVWLVGDSTMADKEVKAYPETGWGMPFANFFDSTIRVDNLAKNGRSTRTFLSEGRWATVMDGLQEGDYVLIQFGHNDEVPSKVGSYTPLEDFKANLGRFVKETRSKGGIPILITPVARRSFDSTGKIRETHPVYAQAVREVATNLQVPLIDLDERSQALLQQFGPEQSKWLFNYLDPGEHPNYPEGHKDDTHFNELGARRMAELVLAEIRKLHLGLAEHIRPPLAVKKG